MGRRFIFLAFDDCFANISHPELFNACRTLENLRQPGMELMLNVEASQL